MEISRFVRYPTLEQRVYLRSRNTGGFLTTLFHKSSCALPHCGRTIYNKRIFNPFASFQPRWPYRVKNSLSPFRAIAADVYANSYTLQNESKREGYFYFRQFLFIKFKLYFIGFHWVNVICQLKVAIEIPSRFVGSIRTLYLGHLVFLDSIPRILANFPSSANSYFLNFSITTYSGVFTVSVLSHFSFFEFPLRFDYFRVIFRIS